MAVSTTLEEQIRRRAYELWEERTLTGRIGDELHDWLTAEAEIQAQIPAKAIPA